jgi:hypothetical protein
MYCTYLTIYKGDKLPKRYIGSSTVDRVLNGYNGSIKSKKYQEIYKQEQRENKHLFKTRILNIYESHDEAVNAEYLLHCKYDVNKNPNYINMAKATRNGFFGNDIRGKNHPRYGKSLTQEQREKVSAGVKKAYAEGRLISPFRTMDFSGENNSFYGRTHTEETKNKMRKPKKHVPRFKCPHCDKTYDAGNLKQHMKRNGYGEEEIFEWKQKNRIGK